MVRIKHILLLLSIGFVTFAAIVTAPVAAQEGGTAADSPAEIGERPFKLPFAQPPGPDTWLLGQPYGNTTGAFRQRFTTYGASGGIHFGLDLSAPCGTEVIAIADGTVFAVDGPFGSPPHNLMIDHPQLGYASMYGHLLAAPDLVPGQQVKQGQVIALSGDSGETCYSRPHLHLEIRDLAHVTKYNPILLIEANWDNLALLGSFGRGFAVDLEAPRKWQSIYDQPEARTAGPIINDFAYSWPFDWEKTTARALMPPPPVPSETMQLETPAPLATSAVGRQLTVGDCCSQFYWSDDASQVRFIDQPYEAQPVGVWGVQVDQAQPEPQLVNDRLGIYSPDGLYVAYPDPGKGVAVVERLADGTQWEIDTQEHDLRFRPDSQHVMWTVFDEEAPSDNREETIWLANVDGSNVRQLLRAMRVNMVSWLSAEDMLMSRRIPGGSDQELYIHSITSGQQTLIGQFPRMRSVLFSPDGHYMVYYVTFEPDGNKNGVWLLDLQNIELAAQKLPFFGTYRWRDNERLVYIPYEAEATQHNFFEYNISSQEVRPLFPQGTNLVITNNEWQVSPDGRRIALLAAKDAALDGIWLLDLP